MCSVAEAVRGGSGGGGGVGRGGGRAGKWGRECSELVLAEDSAKRLWDRTPF